MTASEQPPIACCLGADDYQRRIAWIERLTRTALQRHSRDDLVLRLVYSRDAAGELRRMVEQERECCAFMTFELAESADAVRVTITAPEAVRGSVDMLFGQFLPPRGAGR
jgi:hypothetical protein